MKKSILKSLFILCLCAIMLFLSACGANDTTPTTTKPTVTETTGIFSETSTTASTAKVTAKTTAAKKTTAKTDAASDNNNSAGVQYTTSNAKYKEYLKTRNFVQKIRCGWNLGNSLEATNIWNKPLPNNYTPNDLETGWGNPATTQAMIDKVKSAGFNAVRIGVSWCRFITKSGSKYSIRNDFLARVKQVVNYAYNRNMYVIINIHHDDAEEEWLHISGSDSNFKAVKEEFRQVWTIIANYFKSYNEHLIFEGMNEPIGYDSSGADWWGREDYYFTRLNEMYALFSKTVQATGGNNKTRYLMVPSYGAQPDMRIIERVEMPDDGRMILDVHYYTENPDQSVIQAKFDEILLVSQINNIPVIIGECGIKNSNLEETKIAWAKAYVKTASQMGMRCFIWDDGGNYAVLDRRNLSWYTPDFVSTYVSNAVVMRPGL